MESRLRRRWLNRGLIYSVIGASLFFASIAYGKTPKVERAGKSGVERVVNDKENVQSQAKPQEDYENFEEAEAERFGKAMNRKPVEINYTAIEQIESSGNLKAYNRGSGARGLRQITPIVLEEWNNSHPNETYTLSDLFDGIVNRKIGGWYMEEKIPAYLRHFGLEDNVENRLASYNWGIGNVRKLGGVNEDNLNKLPEETRNYINKYRALSNPEK